MRRALVVTAGLLLVLGAAALLFRRPIGVALTGALVDRSFHNQLVDGLPDGLHAALCGSGSPMPDATRAGPSIAVIAGKHVFVVDAGEGSPRKLALMGISPGLVEGIFLTHFHSDHLGGLGELMLQRWAASSHTDPVPVYGPQGVERVVNGFNEAYALDEGYRVAHHGAATMPPSGNGGVAHPFTIAEGSDASQVLLEEDGLTITAFPVVHTPVFPAVGYRFDYRGRSLVISGDTAPSTTLAKNARGVDLLLHEGLQTTLVSLLHEGAVRANRPSMAKVTADIPSYHTTPEDAARIAQDAGVRQLVFFHTIPPIPAAYFNAAFLGDAPSLYDGPIRVGEDGLVVSLPSASTEVRFQQRL